MKKTLSFIMAGFLACTVSANAAFISGNGTGGTIFDNDDSGFISTITFANDVTSISDVRVHLNISGGFNGDLYAYLVHGDTIAILLNRIGTTGSGTLGSSQSGMNVTLFQSGPPDIHNASPLTPGGSYTADGRYADPNDLNAVFTTSDIRGLNGFNTGTSLGDWTLFIADVDGGGGDATLDSWSLDITGVPEPTNVALGIFGSLFATVQGVRLWKKKKPAKV